MKKSISIILATCLLGIQGYSHAAETKQSTSGQQNEGKSMVVRGLDHIAITVPDIDAATKFLKEAFGAKIAYDLVDPKTDKPLKGTEIEKILGLKSGTQLVHMRMMSLGQSTSIELFEYRAKTQHKAAISSDIGLQHFAVYVDDIQEAARRFKAAGGVLYSDINPIFGEIEGGEKNRFVYGKTPWGTTVELVTYSSGINYPSYSEANRYTPPKP
ncbi:VOC family protein [Acinetobacter sichuanensis]|uniref:VOC family protein n=2 Tax=Acinetobacter sichuanensis TaxID=2136183 RepID=A0ABV7BFM1_9GAMM|nr:VOC family protein [Acinetobacter sichuanensis]